VAPRARRLRIYLLPLLLLCGAALAAVLPEERADLLYHSYDGGGVEVTGPSLLLRKDVGGSVSLGLNYYVDNVSSASIDVITTASPYTERRVENSVSVDYLRNKSTMSLGVTRSDESDYEASTVALGVSQDMFGDLTTVSLGFALGDNVVRQNGNPDFEEDVQVRSYRVGISQIFTRNLVTALTLEAITDEGFLNNPYRSVRYADSSSPNGYSYQPEVYPRTRTSNAIALRARYYLPQRAALHGGVRLFEDTWGIDAVTYELGYTLPYRENWILDARLRLHDQSSAEFYSDLFPFQDAQNYLARDKELSTFTSTTVGFSASYTFARGWSLIDRGSLNLELDWIQFDYADFRDLTRAAPAGEEPLYNFDAQVTRLFASFWF
jgi:hypothetical protein